MYIYIYIYIHSLIYLFMDFEVEPLGASRSLSDNCPLRRLCYKPSPPKGEAPRGCRLARVGICRRPCDAHLRDLLTAPGAAAAAPGWINSERL